MFSFSFLQILSGKLQIVEHTGVFDTAGSWGGGPRRRLLRPKPIIVAGGTTPLVHTGRMMQRVT